MNLIRTFTATLALALLGQHSALAVTVPFTEDYSTNDADWKDVANGNVDYFAAGGIGGSGYISTVRTFTANPTTAQTVFRAHDSFDSSGDAFVGNWQSAGVTEFSHWIRHDAATELSFSTRFATSANSPGANAVSSLGLIAQPNVWTEIVIPISPAAIAPEGPPSVFDDVFQNLGNLQVTARPTDDGNLNTPIRFDLDRVSIVPEPTSSALLAGAALVLAGYRRRRS